MKMKQICLLISLMFSFPLLTNAQEIYEGTRKNLQTNTSEHISYTCTSYSEQNIFYNHYSIFLQLSTTKADTVFLVDINFDKPNNSIIIRQLDKSTNQTYFRTINFHPLSYLVKKSEAKPIYCIRNYECNDTLLSVTNDNNSEILFTIADTINPLIFLHQVASIDKSSRFDLDKFRKSYLTPHLEHAKDYWLWSKMESEKRTRDSILDEQKKIKLAAIQSAIDKELHMINSDRDRLITRLSEKQKAIRLSDTMADDGLQELFTKRVDKIFSDYLSDKKNINTVITGSYKLYVSADQPIRIIRKQTPEIINNWVSQQLDSIYSVIKFLPLENKVISACTDDPFSIIISNHSARGNQLKQDLANQGFSYDSVFTPTFNSIQVELKKVCENKINVTTIYSYPFQYESKSVWDKWIVKNKNIRARKDTLAVNKENIDGFYKIYPKAKSGKYNVRMNTTLLNSSLYGPGLDTARLKYKFLTHVGFSAGTFIHKGVFLAGKDLYESNIYYWNLFLIIHHIGFFGGSTSDGLLLPEAQIKNYSEGGIYVAPGKYLYFKVGFAKYTDTHKIAITKPVLGVSLIFPVVQLEAGYNFVFNYPYVMAGLNLPLNF